LAPDLADGHARLGEVLVYRDWNWEAGEVELRRAIELAPNDPEVLCSLGTLLDSIGRRMEGLELLRRAVALDPLNPQALRALGRCCTMQGLFEDADRALHQALDVNPKSGVINYWLAISCLLQGRFREAAEWAGREVVPIFRTLVLACARHSLGQQQE